MHSKDESCGFILCILSNHTNSFTVNQYNITLTSLIAEISSKLILLLFPYFSSQTELLGVDVFFCVIVTVLFCHDP